MLKDLNIKEVYNSEDDNILEDFYIPVLQNAVSYDRAVGYFDAKVLTSAARGLASFVENDGYIRLIVGATLDEDEYKAISLGYSQREVLERLEIRFDRELKAYSDDLFLNQLNTLTWFIKNKKLDIKIALRKGGIYHEKVGIIRDKNTDFLVFQGSANETNNALTPFNYESINVFKSWLPEFKGHIEPHVKKFETLWNDKARNTRVIDFTQIAKNLLTKKIGEPYKPSLGRELELWQHYVDSDYEAFDFKGPRVPEKIYGNKFELRDHQTNALNEWKNNNFRGLFELATGAGKTITAIYGAVKMFESRKKLLLVISVPYQALADQWVDNLRVFNINPILCYGGELRWHANLKEKLIDFQTGLTNFMSVVVVDATLSSKTKTFYNLIDSLGEGIKNHFLFVGDECHHHGATVINKCLPENANLRIGLSATPDRGEDDQEGNDNLKNYYGATVAKYTLEDALRDDVLTPYDYHLIDVTLTPEECEKYIELSKKISRLYAASRGNVDGNNNALNILFNKRARLINGCKNKPIELKKLLSEMPPIFHSLFYCAEGKLDDSDLIDEDDEGLKQIELISKILHELNWKSSRFTADEDKLTREAILKNFKDKNIHSLVAMKCLDEGIDVPACSTAFILASSKKPRQFVQRRGRILRKSKGKEKAVIYDFFVTLPIDRVDDGGIERKLLISELARINEFSGLSLNKGDAYKKIEPYLIKNDLVHYFN